MKKRTKGKREEGKERGKGDEEKSEICGGAFGLYILSPSGLNGPLASNGIATLAGGKRRRLRESKVAGMHVGWFGDGQERDVANVV